MSRRPSSIALASDDTVILCADKFGDVYALPLLPSANDEITENAVPSAQYGEKDFTPSATVLTVHSGRNRRTLEEQLKQKAKGPLKTKDAMTFKHELLLGHVAMLTDLAVAKVGDRSYIVTADRDEHIRISRGLPQAHIIEGFCFGHEEFVSRLCLTRNGLLVSGGGDAQLFVWDWQKYQLVQRLPLRDTALCHIQSRTDLSAPLQDESSFKVAVSGIWAVPSNSNEVRIVKFLRAAVFDKFQADEILVACEGLPTVFSFEIGRGEPTTNTIALTGNALGVAFVQTSSGPCTTIVSIDNVHQAGSTTQARDDKVRDYLPPLHSHG